jgi:hypothetical protein
MIRDKVEIYENAVKKISDSFKELKGNITLGIDGYIDEVWQIVEERAGLDEYTLYNKMKNFGEAIVKCRDGGFAQEIVRIRRSYGGFTGNTGNALGRLGVNPVMIGMYGENAIDPVFEQLNDKCELISLGAAAICHIYEFEDGKIMFPHLEKILSFNWGDLQNNVEFNKIEEIFLNSDIIALGYWSSMPSFDELVSKVCENYVEEGRCKKMFFDFADIRKRDKKSLLYTLDCLVELNKIVPMTLSLNENEAELLFSYYGRDFDERQLEKSLVDVRKKINIEEIVVHTPYVAAASNEKEGFAKARNRYCHNPVITAGAGDTFNGGYLAATLGMLSVWERLITANATTAFYVRKGYAPSIADLITEINNMTFRENGNNV